VRMMASAIDRVRSAAGLRPVGRRRTDGDVMVLESPFGGRWECS
jgi:hypothetical protein